MIGVSLFVPSSTSVEADREEVVERCVRRRFADFGTLIIMVQRILQSDERG